MFDLTDVDEMQKKLYPEYQVVVLSASHDNAVISRSPPTKTIGMQEVVVYHCMDHFDLITNLEGFLMSGQYCEHCEKAYSHKERHHCSGTCPYCFRSNDKCVTSTMQSCDDCGRKFRNQDCFKIHKKPGRSGISLKSSPKAVCLQKL